MTKLQTIRTILKDAGFQPRVQDDYVAFQHEGGTYVIPVDSDDEAYVRLIFPNFWSIDDAKEHARVLEVAAMVTSRMKNVKVYPHEGNTMACVELLMPRVEDFARVFPRALAALQTAARNFQLTMQIGRGDLPGGEMAIADLLRRMIEQARGDERGREAG